MPIGADSESGPNSPSDDDMEEDEYEDVEEIEVDEEEGVSDREHDHEEEKGKEEKEEEGIPYEEDEGREGKGNKVGEEIPNGEGFDGMKSDIISSKPDHSPELQTRHSSVSDVKEMDQNHQTAVISEKHTISLEGECLKSLAGEDTDTSNVEQDHPSADINHLSVENTMSLNFDWKESEIQIMVCKDSYLEKEVKWLPKEIDLQAVSEKPRSLRSRSPSADVGLETSHKRPALMICNFFTKGWCIKGNACRFLHQKDGTENAGKSTKGELHETKSKIYSKDDAGLNGETKTFENPSSSSNVIFHRALVRTYGDEKQGEEFSTSKVSDRHQLPFTNGRSKSTFNHLYGRPNSYRDLSSSLNERMLYKDMAGSDHLGDRFSSRNSLPTGNSPIPDPRFSSSNPPIYLSRMHDPFYNEKYTLDRSLLRQQNQYESSNLYRSEIFDPAHPRSFHHRHALTQTYPQQVNSYGHHYASQSNDLLDENNALHFDKGYRSRSCSTFGSYPPQNVSQDAQVSMNRRTQHMAESNWEPSMRFCSSFNCSSGNQYDPLLNSIDHQMASSQSPTGLRASTHLVARESHSLTETVSRSHESSYISGHGIKQCVSVSTDPPFGIAAEEREWSTFVVDVAGTTQMGYNVRNQGDEDKQTKESKVLKNFRDVLIEFVKDLLKPTWREGQLSKDSHKLIVKKAVEKVLGTLQPYQIPSNAESTSQYFSISRPKITKLVEGYVEKYRFGNQ